MLLLGSHWMSEPEGLGGDSFKQWNWPHRFHWTVKNVEVLIPQGIGIDGTRQHRAVWWINHFHTYDVRKPSSPPNEVSLITPILPPRRLSFSDIQWHTQVHVLLKGNAAGRGKCPASVSSSLPRPPNRWAFSFNGKSSMCTFQSPLCSSWAVWSWPGPCPLCSSFITWVDNDDCLVIIALKVSADVMATRSIRISQVRAKRDNLEFKSTLPFTC